MKAKIIVATIILVAWLSACVDVFQAGIVSDLTILVVDAALNNLDTEQHISIMESVNAKGTVFNIPVRNAKVEVLENNSNRISFIEKREGVYVAPTNFKLVVGNTYQLFFTKSDGKSYESGTEKLSGISEIIKIHDVFEMNGIQKGDKYLPANYVFIDTQDPKDEENNYLWTWQQWEKQDICITCEGGRYNVNTGCLKQAQYQGQFFDYYCEGNCWDILKNTELNVLNDVLSNGKLIANRLVAKIPYHSTNGTLLEIQQQSISVEAYKYFKLLAEQTQNTGTLVDTPPAAIIGNIKNINNAIEPVVGFFFVTSITKKRYWLDRNVPNTLKIQPIGLRDHPLNQEPPIPNEFGRPPLVKCLLGPTRTPIKPDGWGE